MTDELLSPTFLFRFSVPCRRFAAGWTASGAPLDESYRLPSFRELEGHSLFAELRAGWSERGLYFWLRVTGKRQTPWCRHSKIDESDGLAVWIDTRDTHSVHRAGRFCHRFMILPRGGGRKMDEPVAELLPINRAREAPKPVAPDKIRVRSEARIDGYLLNAHLPAEALTGFDPAEQPRVGFTYAVVDRELGWQTFSVGPEYRFQEDPSLWGTLELVD